MKPFLFLLVAIAAVAAKADAIKMCVYSGNSICDESGTVVCVEGDGGKCVDTTQNGSPSSAMLTCKSDGVDFNRFATRDCTGPTNSVTLVGDDKKCIAYDGNSYKFEGCNDGDCFPADAMVEFRDGALKRMDEVEIGDEVRVSREEFSEVFFWGHKDVDTATGNYVQIALESGRRITLSGNHLVYVNGKLRPALQVAVGDVLVDADVGASTVTQVDAVVKKGLYNPHTLHGDIVVDGVVASTHTAAQLSAISHMLLAVERCAYRLGFSLFGAMLETQRPAVLTALMGALPSGK
mmetsp:Transcript_9320/g.24649  ORF Transcript_9320/g.24649 Transcript_9320/m.24649 type:complete len:293 (+) Transcript_9320:429-1307(+)|eukprot:CAMPEP_0185829078 /NCGR_PEP_ID=MMETSP1353-20130828/27_1 /TAXON_ID=1077150 /ORGANISM="Erythrolobus australicus, Strain CCMP3124" /LENGTH=292 /DNA_ID=CAMNT_0028526823 /DNA_START=384 /DNA_END=1262 /DNA_ORIENTATION=-